jgi:two-component system sensor histidine kinase RegB
MARNVRATIAVVKRALRHRAAATPHAFGCGIFRDRTQGMEATSAQKVVQGGIGAPPRSSEGAAHDGTLGATDERGRIHLSWLVQLHWWAILGQAVVIVAADAVTGIVLPSTTLVGFLVVEVVGNVALGAWAARVRVTDAAITAVMVLDIVVLTVLLDLTGGASNPFSTLYLVNIALAAVLLPSRWSWSLMAASLLAFGSLFVHEALVGPAHHVKVTGDPAHMMAAHLRGMWVAFALSAIFVVFFVQRVSNALAERDRELDQTRTLAARREKLASLATLAAGAAHELGQPLGTIAIVAKELERALADDGREEVRGDLRLVREMVARCRAILNRMSARAGEHAGEAMQRITGDGWKDSALDGLPTRDRVVIERIDPELEIIGPPLALGDALRGLLRNGLQASGPGSTVTLRITSERGRVRAAVKDRGPGMPPEVLARVGEPFFTTKGPGDGMGLGLFLTRALAEQLGGEFHIASRPGEGTEAWLDLPASNAGDRSTA